MACTKNPILEYLTNAIADSQSIYNYVTDNQFINIGSSELFCTPEFEFYFLGPMSNKLESGDSPLKSIQTLLGLKFPFQCCENYDINDALFANLTKNSETYDSKSCCNSFSNCVADLNNLIQVSPYSDYDISGEIYKYGIQEYSTFDSDSMLCLINSKLNTTTLENNYYFVKSLLFYGGFVAYFHQGNIYVGTAQGFTSWYNSL